MPTAKITLTLEQDEETGTNAAMEDTIKLLGTIETLPAMKLVLTLECADVIAESYRQKLRLGLKRRSPGIKIKIATKTEEEVACERLPNLTPMDRAWADDESTSGEKVLDWLVAREQRGAGDENLFDDEV
jgi:hypothetical protein